MNVSDAAETTPVKKKGKLGKLLLIGGGALVLLGGGVGAGLYASGAGLAGSHEPKEDPNKPKLVLKEGVEEADASHATGKKGAHKSDAPDPAKYQASYQELGDNFTSNLRDSDGFMQVSLGVSTFYDERVFENLERNKLPVRSAVLMTLADQDAFAIETPEGKKALQTQLKAAINGVLEGKEGFGGISDVYFTSFIIQ